MFSRPRYAHSFAGTQQRHAFTACAGMAFCLKYNCYLFDKKQGVVETKALYMMLVLDRKVGWEIFFSLQLSSFEEANIIPERWCKLLETD